MALYGSFQSINESNYNGHFIVIIYILPVSIIDNKNIILFRHYCHIDALSPIFTMDIITLFSLRLTSLLTSRLSRTFPSTSSSTSIPLTSSYLTFPSTRLPLQLPLTSSYLPFSCNPHFVSQLNYSTCLWYSHGLESKYENDVIVNQNMFYLTKFWIRKKKSKKIKISSVCLLNIKFSR